MIKINKDDYLDVSKLFNNILENMSINDFSDVNIEFLDLVNKFKSELIKSDVIYNDLARLKNMLNENNKKNFSILYDTTIDLLTSFSYNESIYYNTLNNKMSTVPKFNETILLANFKISIKRSNIFSAMQKKVVEYYLDIISEDDLINEFYKSFKRKFMNSFKKNVAENFTAYDVAAGITVSNVMSIESFVRSFDSFGLSSNFLFMDMDSVKLMDLNESDFLFLINIPKDKNVLSGINFVTKSIFEYMKVNYESLDIDYVKQQLFSNWNLDNLIDYGLAKFFSDDDFRKVYKCLYKYSLKQFVNNTKLRTFKIVDDIDVFYCDTYKLFKYDINNIYNEIFTDIIHIDRYNVIYPNAIYSLENSDYNIFNNYNLMKKLIDLCKLGEFKIDSIVIEGPGGSNEFNRIMIAITNNIEIFNTIDVEYRKKIKESDLFSEEDFNKYIKPIVKEL